MTRCVRETADEQRNVDPQVTGSSPVGHPILPHETGDTSRQDATQTDVDRVRIVSGRFTPGSELPGDLRGRADTRATPLLRKLADLSDEEWAELTHRMVKHFEREMAARDYVMVPADSCGGIHRP